MRILVDPIEFGFNILAMVELNMEGFVPKKLKAICRTAIASHLLLCARHKCNLQKVVRLGKAVDEAGGTSQHAVADRGAIENRFSSSSSLDGI